MALPQTGNYTKAFRNLLILPLLILFLLLLTNNRNILLILLPLVLLLIFVQRELNSFHEVQNNLALRRSFSKTRINEGNDITVTLEISNQSEFDSHVIELTDEIPQPFDLVHSTNTFVFSLKKKEKISLSYKISTFEIGIYNFNEVSIKHRDIFNLFVESFSLKQFSPDIIINPRLEKFENVPIYPFWMRYFNGYFSSNQFGNDDDFMGIREFQYGDRLKRINWKATSKYQRTHEHNLYSNFFNVDKAVDVELIVDLTFESFPVYIDSIRALGSLTEFFLRTRNKVGLTIAKQFSEHIDIKSGKRQLQIIIDKLLRTKVDIKLNDKIVTDKLLQLSTRFSKKAIILMISPMINEFILEYCEKIKSKGSSIMIIKINSLDKQLGEISSGKFEELIPLSIPIYFNIISFDFLIQNFLSKDKLLALSIPVLEWNPEYSLQGYLNSHRGRIQI